MEFVAVCILVLVLDLASKGIVASLSTPGTPIPLAGGLVCINQTFNPGAAFGLMPGRTWLFLTLTSVITLVGLAWAVKSRDRTSRLALGVIMGGALANAIDRLGDGYVFDFIDVRVWPVFNLADIAIVVGTVVFSLRAILALVSDAGERRESWREDGR